MPIGLPFCSSGVVTMNVVLPLLPKVCTCVPPARVASTCVPTNSTRSRLLISCTSGAPKIPDIRFQTAENASRIRVLPATPFRPSTSEILPVPSAAPINLAFGSKTITRMRSNNVILVSPAITSKPSAVARLTGARSGRFASKTSATSSASLTRLVTR